MSFTTLTFACFVFIVFALHWSARTRGGQNMVILIASYCFYGWWDARFCLLMLVSSLVDFVIARGIHRSEGVAARRALLVLSVLVNLGMLGFFKYFNFFMDSAAVLAAQMGIHLSEVELRVVLPVGISFYTFQTMSYTIDVYRRRLTPTRNLTAYMAYVASFPQLVAGPIERGERYLPQFLHMRRFDHDKAVDGCRQILWGMFKKLIIADRLGVVVDVVYGDVGSASGPMVVFATVCFAFQIYCDFSAYSDIAIGTGRLFGLDLMRNFAYPYFSRSPAEFWRRWHISLSTWFRDYVYIPLGGSRVSRGRLVFNILLTFAVSGLWHGASWNFVLWGLIMGASILPEAVGGIGGSGRERERGRPAELGGMAITFAVVCLGWVFFRAATLGDAMLALRKSATEWITPDAWLALGTLMDDNSKARTAPILLAVIIGVEWTQRRHAHALQVASLPRPARWAVYTALLWLTLLVGSQENNPFIYFQF